MPKKQAGENSKKAAGNARKAAAADAKADATRKVVSAKEDAEWSKGSKGPNAKAEAAAAKKAEDARKKAEAKALLEKEEASMPSKPKPKGADKVAAKRAGKIDDFISATNKAPALAASNIDDALDMMTLVEDRKVGTKKNGEVDRHPERRFKAAFAAYEERRLPELKEEHKGLRLQQMKDMIYKEFQKSPENPFNQVHATHNMTKEELKEMQANEQAKTEARLVGR
ncbi:DUF1014-domain-containing protein [Saitoella complicata NRRL Y-17804]|uniref:HMG box domain-containing protein n=1 Tax=Saitoella complicata (strain BCRC 22490 / CBS 7301 / JCM 7358 / NBRC 10748 / NRRL Y-17804) TaxID=698492 RepID=A0A0E9NGR8_SAICN|nr:DUF1014-domain-containing protein [Saitoella complicata NRRL Y-17804]ODQ52009.1 DUF1014-domain-containing protein [Saitoella complicata NRRL Y-17804]GAO48605.1 hypothetical protein G7K_2776-t1 [Saitoella complicata NRRL Y-17804]